MLTVALPVWNNRSVIWLPMEGLARQETGVSWELIVMECFSTNMIGEAYFREFFERRIKKAGCTRLKYIYSDRRLPLSAKWKEMYRNAKGRHFLLQGSDDYPHPERLQQTWEADADWFDIQRYWHYHLGTNQLIIFDSCTGKRNVDGQMLYMAGENMSIRTELLKGLPAFEASSGVDHYILNNCDIRHRSTLPGPFAGISTTGMNTISITRDRYFRKVTEPFYPTSENIGTIGLPEDVVLRLKEYIL